MKKHFILTAVLGLFAFAALAGEPVRHTIIVKDGKVVKDGQLLQFDKDLFGGKRAYLGVTLVELTSELRTYFGAPSSSGVLVSSIEEGGPADKAGVRVGDVIVAIDGKDVESPRALRSELRERKGGQTARLDVIRGKARHSIVATVAEREGLQAPMLKLEELGKTLDERFNSDEWRARIAARSDCNALQARIRDLESRLHDLEKKLQK